MTTEPAPDRSTGHAPTRALLVEDDDAVRRSLQLLMQARGVAVRSFASIAAAIAGHDAGDEVLVADYRLPDGDGIGLLAALRARGWAGRAFLVTAFPSAGLCAAARDAGFDQVLEKPLRRHSLIAALNLPPSD